jgi:hypothetical protein
MPAPSILLIFSIPRPSARGHRCFLDLAGHPAPAELHAVGSCSRKPGIYPLADDLPLELALLSPDKLNKTLSVATVGEQGGAMLDGLISVETLLLVATVAVVLAIVCGAI